MNSKRRYKIWIYSVILGQLECFRNQKGFSIILPKIVDAIIRITKVSLIFLTPSITFLKIIHEWKDHSRNF